MSDRSTANETTASATVRPGGSATFGDRSVARIGYGAMQLPRLAENRDDAIGVLRRVYELGIDHVDTAEFYGLGFVNQVIRGSDPGAHDVMVVSKVGWDPDPSPDAGMPLRLAQRPEQLRQSVIDNLASLGMDQIPVVNLRRIDVGPDMNPPADQVVDLDDQLAEMTAMRDEGLIGGIGLSTVTMDVLRRALPAGIACVQNAYSLVDRKDDDMAELCASENIAWVPYFPLGSAFPGLPKVADEQAVQEVARELGVTPAQVGLAWLLHHTPNTLLIPGTASIEHLEVNTAVGDIVLTDDMVASLDTIGTRVAEHP